MNVVGNGSNLKKKKKSRKTYNKFRFYSEFFFLNAIQWFLHFALTDLKGTVTFYSIKTILRSKHSFHYIVILEGFVLVEDVGIYLKTLHYFVMTRSEINISRKRKKKIQTNTIDRIKYPASK